MTDLLDSTPDALSTVRRPPVRPGVRAVRAVRRLRARPWGDPALAGALALILSVAFSWVPSIWYDESATIVSARRTYGQLWAEIHTVDAVHAFYYALMHAWLAVVGYSPFTLRLPSAIAVGITAALLVVLARRLTDRRTALVAGLLFAMLPRITWAGGEGRSYAGTAMLAVLLTLVLMRASRPGGDHTRRWWIAYGLVAFVATTLFLYTALVVVAHGVTLAVRAWGARRGGGRSHGAQTPEARAPEAQTPGGATGVGWRALFGWAAASAAAGILLAPLARLSIDQSHQVGWLARPSIATVASFLQTQWFTGSPLLAVVGWGLVVVALVLGLRRHDDLLVVALPWLLLPALALIGVSLVHAPLYSERYVTFSAPALALVMATGLTAARLRSVVALGLVVVALLAAPAYVHQRTVTSKNNSSWSQVAALVTRERAHEAPGATDAIVYGPIRNHPTGSARSMAYAYPAAFTGMTDVTLKTPAAETGALWETRLPLAATIDRVQGHRYVWLITSDQQDLRPTVTRRLGALGYHVDGHWHFAWVNVVRYER